MRPAGRLVLHLLQRLLAGGQIQGLFILNNEAYVPERWHGTLLIIAVASFAIIINTLVARKIPLIVGTLLVLHIFGFFTIFISMWVLDPRRKASDVFGSFQGNAGWGDVGLLKYASKMLPRAVIWTAVVNNILGILMLITFCFCLGDVESVLITATGQPHIQILYNATQSKASATVLIPSQPSWRFLVRWVSSNGNTCEQY